MIPHCLEPCESEFGLDAPSRRQEAAMSCLRFVTGDERDDLSNATCWIEAVAMNIRLIAGGDIPSYDDDEPEPEPEPRQPQLPQLPKWIRLGPCRWVREFPDPP
jgi:hypothetical protein